MADAQIPPVGEIELICPNCGYDLRGIASTLCPECGQPFDRDSLAQSQLPWLHRHDIGTAKAYLRTAWLAIRRPGTLANEITRPISFAQADRFRRLTIWIVWPMLVIVGLVCGRTELHNLGWSEWIVVAALAAGARVYLISLTTSPGVFCRPNALPPERRTRAEALSMYASGSLLGLLPVSLLAIPITIYYAIPGLPFEVADRLSAFTALAAALVLLITAVSFWVTSIILIVRTTTAGRAIAAAFLLPLIWVSTAAVFLALLPAAVAYLLLIIHSIT